MVRAPACSSAGPLDNHTLRVHYIRDTGSDTGGSGTPSFELLWAGPWAPGGPTPPTFGAMPTTLLRPWSTPAELSRTRVQDSAASGWGPWFRNDMLTQVHLPDLLGISSTLVQVSPPTHTLPARPRRQLWRRFIVACSLGRTRLSAPPKHACGNDPPAETKNVHALRQRHAGRCSILGFVSRRWTAGCSSRRATARAGSRSTRRSTAPHRASKRSGEMKRPEGSFF